MKYSHWIVGISICLLTSQVSAQEKPATISIGEKQTIQSKILGETRELLVSAPDDLAKQLPLIIVFDGESLFNTTVAAVKFMNYSSEIPQMPEALIIGIPNTDRNRDMPIPQEYGKIKGEDNFLKFIQEELIPSLNRKYSLNGHTVLIGHSQGGYFVSYMLERSPAAFSWAVALDAPMTVDPKTASLKESLSKTLLSNKNKFRYASVETVYGWGNEWIKYLNDPTKTIQLKLPNETHESMPFKGIYDGLSFLYHDFAPPHKDMKLAELQAYYRSVSEKYGYIYEIPLRVLTASASRKIMESRKTEIIDLINYAETKYAITARTTHIKEEAMKISKEPPHIADSFLALAKPSPEQVKKYIGHWVGELTVRMGQNMPLDIEITIENGEAFMRAVLPWAPNKKETVEIFSVSKKGELVYGRRNRGSGVVISTASINEKGQLTGEEWLLGFTIPDDMPDDIKERMDFILKNPNVFTLVKQ